MKPATIVPNPEIMVEPSQLGECEGAEPSHQGPSPLSHMELACEALTQRNRALEAECKRVSTQLKLRDVQRQNVEKRLADATERAEDLSMRLIDARKAHQQTCATHGVTQDELRETRRMYSFWWKCAIFLALLLFWTNM